MTASVTRISVLVFAMAFGVACGGSEGGTVARDAASERDSGSEGQTDAAGNVAADAADEDAARAESMDAGADGSDANRIVVHFRGRVGANDYGCQNVYPDQGSTKAQVTGRDFRFFVHNVRLLQGDGAEVPLALDDLPPSQSADVALLDFQNPDGLCGAERTPTRLTGRAEPGSYTGIAFTVGVPEALNHGDPALATAPLRGSGLSWGWLQGYRFFVGEVAVVGTPDAAVSDAGTGAVADAGDDAGDGQSAGGSGSHEFEPGVGMFHSGSTGCIGSPANGISCSKSNRAEIRLNAFDPRTQTIIVDLGAVFTASDIAAGAQCHGRGEVCTSMFRALGVDIATGKLLPSQSVFRVE